MAGHFPFSGNGGRASTTAFYERYGFNEALQEKYYKWWYEWAKAFVTHDAELSLTKGIAFAGYPYGQHAHRNFHLNDKHWAVCLSDLGDFIKGAILPKLDEAAVHKLEEEHHKMLDELKQEAGTSPREPAPDVGYFRHT